MPRLVELIKGLTQSVGEEAGSKQSLRKAVHTLTELAKTGAPRAPDPASAGPQACAAADAAAAEDNVEAIVAAGAVLVVVPLLTLFSPSPSVAAEGLASWRVPWPRQRLLLSCARPG